MKGIIVLTWYYYMVWSQFSRCGQGSLFAFVSFNAGMQTGIGSSIVHDATLETKAKKRGLW